MSRCCHRDDLSQAYVDWAPEPVVADTLEFLSSAGVRATLLATDHSPRDWIRSYSKLESNGRSNKSDDALEQSLLLQCPTIFRPKVRCRLTEPGPFVGQTLFEVSHAKGPGSHYTADNHSCTACEEKRAPDRMRTRAIRSFAVRRPKFWMVASTISRVVPLAHQTVRPSSTHSVPGR